MIMSDDEDEEELSGCCGAERGHPDIDICSRCNEWADFDKGE
jgi:hypothetical protein